MGADVSPETVLAMAGQLREYANHFPHSDWDYTRDTGDLECIRHRSDHTGGNRFSKRLLRALDNLVGVRRRDADPIFDLRPRDLRSRCVRFVMALRKENHLPDGVLDGGRVITRWEETGEYLQYVQPSVGSLLADWMEAEPSNEHCLTIASEMKRINDRYGYRLEHEEETA